MAHGGDRSRPVAKAGRDLLGDAHLYVTRPYRLVTVRVGTCGLGVHGASIAVNATLFHFRSPLGGGILPDP
jgi:hypothetical protein